MRRPHLLELVQPVVRILLELLKSVFIFLLFEKNVVCNELLVKYHALPQVWEDLYVHFEATQLVLTLDVNGVHLGVYLEHVLKQDLAPLDVLDA